MANWQVASRYAQSLFQLALEKGILEQIYKDIVAFNQTLIDHPTLSDALQSPILSHQEKWHILQKLFGQKVSDLGMRFFKMVVQKHRETLLPVINSCFLKQYDHYQAIKTAHITTTFTLSKDLLTQFKKLVQNMSPCKEVNLVQHIKPSILGGFILQVEDKRLDESLSTKLRLLKKQCITSGY